MEAFFAVFLTKPLFAFFWVQNRNTDGDTAPGQPVKQTMQIHGKWLKELSVWCVGTSEKPREGRTNWWSSVSTRSYSQQNEIHLLERQGKDFFSRWWSLCNFVSSRSFFSDQGYKLFNIYNFQAETEFVYSWPFFRDREAVWRVARGPQNHQTPTIAKISRAAPS